MINKYFAVIVGRLVTLLFMSLFLFPEVAIAFCVEDSNTCVEGAETRLINGHSVHRACWRYAKEFTCDGTTAVEDSHCQELRDQGCSPIGQTCDADSCDQTYECNVGTVTTPEGDCDNQAVAIAGLNYDTGYTGNNDLGLAASNMAVLEGAVTGMIKNDLSCAESPPGSGNMVCAEPIQVFTGKDLACRKDAVGFNKCCKLNGWGTDAGLTECNAQEHELGYARKAGRTHYVGKFCSHDSLFGCVGYRYVYCSFTSKIGRIIQEQGKPQLGLGWGSARTPICSGLTPDQLTQLDFELIDFSEYFGDAFADMTNPPSAPEMQSIVDTYLNRLTATTCSQFDPGCTF